MVKKIYILVGTRPNFIKVTRFKALAELHNMEVKLIHTGQHFDRNMADVFFSQFNLVPDYFLNIGGLTAVQQIGEIILRLEKLIDEIGKPDYFIVPGDVNSTLAGAIFANKTGIKLVHLESGLRSNDRLMPEEHNRILTDNLADICFVTEQSGIDNLTNENSTAQVHLVGNTMIDTLVHFETQINESPILEELKLSPKEFILATFHRPSNVDGKIQLTKLVELMEWLTTFKKVVLPIHPRTKSKLVEFGLFDRLHRSDKIVLTEPLGYFSFQRLIKDSFAVITDSGGIQEETTYRQVPCLTLRENTERPITLTKGTNTLVTFDLKQIGELMDQILNGTYKVGVIPELWDGNTTERILRIL